MKKRVRAFRTIKKGIKAVNSIMPKWNKRERRSGAFHNELHIVETPWLDRDDGSNLI